FDDRTLIWICINYRDIIDDSHLDALFAVLFKHKDLYEFSAAKYLIYRKYMQFPDSVVDKLLMFMQSMMRTVFSTFMCSLGIQGADSQEYKDNLNVRNFVTSEFLDALRSGLERDCIDHNSTVI